ncbi:PepSY domain-containing protein [Methylobacterium sp. GC_Met_2]|uniref:PepSY-associated TM helix domain-containing protein n=1 Tax=Methylobacterium sp. GC_Met_2 TaxID=2937376 RepID=UPI00226B18A8|nr:PepSY domain-containing protein [Methylobacterium sp. GC_Met_2]
MSTVVSGNAPAYGARTALRASREVIYRAVWRWHFLAGLLCLPFLITLSATGSLYLFKDEINGSLFAYRTRIPVRETPPLGPDRLIFNAMQAVPDAGPVSYTDPATPETSALVTLAVRDHRILVYLDPYTGAVLDCLARDQEFMVVLRGLHSLAYLGAFANAVIEVVAGFAVILVLTGAYLWWPRGRDGGVISVRGTPRQRVWWRDLHAVTGLLAGGGLLFLALTGLPWSIWWGQQMRGWSNAAGLGQPGALWAHQPVSTVPLRERLSDPGWTLEDAPVPRSSPAAASTQTLGIDRAAAILAERGMPRGYELALPVGDDGVYAASVYPRHVTRQRVIALDQYTGANLLDVRFADLGPVGRAIQYGIGIHKGEHWGRANQFAMLAFCLATILLAVTAGTMWWKRRPAGGLGVPPWPRDRRVIATVTLLVAGLGALFPLTGLAILGMIGLDLAAQRLRRRVRA